MLELATSLSNIYFFMTDVDDVNGMLTLHTADGTSASFPMSMQNGNIYFVGITSDVPIGKLEWINTSNGDGFGLDDFGVVEEIPQVPEPATLPVVAAGLCAIILLRRHIRFST